MTSLNEYRNKKVWVGYSVKMRWACLGLVLGVLGGFLLARAGPFFELKNEQSLGLPMAQAYETEVEVKALVSLCGAEMEATYTGFKIHKEHELVGKVYRTDTISGVGKTRVAVCVDAEGYTVTGDETRLTVTVEPTSVRLLLPSVDHWGSQLEYNDGADWAMLNPLVAESTDLYDVAYMWLQLQATEGACMEAAWDSAIEKLERAIRKFESKSSELSPLNVNVVIDTVQSLEEARAQVDKEINLSGVRERQALSLLRNSEQLRVESDHVVETCSVVGEV